MPKEERPRERLKKVGVDNLSLAELLALVIERGKRGENVLTIAQNLISHFGNLAKIKEATIEELCQVKGIGFATACKLKAAFKLGEKAQVSSTKYGQKIQSAKDVFKLLKNDLGDKKKEHFKVLSLDSRNNLIGVDDVSIGTINANLVHPREVFKTAIQHLAATVVIAHNHPSGDPEPSEDDIEITKRLVEAGKLIGIDILDHIIIAKDNFFSFKNKRII
ncbi:MAG: DNA repair protein RadC [Thermodesulfobacterium sp.]|nr:DNA repair protein RadC [Thermodesulfobacterium sp.]